MTQTITLRLQCDDRPGLVARVANVLARVGCNIEDAQQYNDRLSARFFMRATFVTPEGMDLAAVERAFAPEAAAAGMDWTMTDQARPRKVLLMVSKFDHCLGDLLYRHRLGELPMDVVGIASNHPQAVLHTSLIGEIPYHHLPITRDTKPQQEARIKALVESSGAELVVFCAILQAQADWLMSHIEELRPTQQVMSENLRKLYAEQTKGVVTR